MQRFCAIIIVVLISASASFAAPFVTPRDPQCVAFSPNGSLVALGYSGLSNGEFPPRPHPDVRKCGCVQIHDVESGKRLRRIETYGDLVDLRFSPDGKYLAMARVFATVDEIELNEVRVWTVADGKLAAALDRCHAFTFLPQPSRILVLGRKTCAEFDLSAGKRLRTIEQLSNSLAVQAVGESQLVGVVRTEQLVRTEQSPPQYALRLVDSTSGQQVAESLPLEVPMFHIAVSVDKRYVATGLPGNVLLWNAAQLKPLAKLPTDTRGVAHPFFSPDGELLAAGDQTSGDVVIWKLTSGQELYRYTFQKGNFRSYFARGEAALERPERDPARFVFSPDSAAFLSGSYSGILRTVLTGQELRRFGE